MSQEVENGLDLKIPKNILLKPNITILGLGGAGCNAVNNMIAQKLSGVNFVIANTDSQSLEYSQCSQKLQLGINTTQGLGAGSSPEVGKISAEESKDDIKTFLEGSNMLFITAGMGGGTGTGAAPVVAQIAKELDILTVAFITKPFDFEGSRRMKTAEQGIEELQKYVDTLVIIPNQNLFRIVDEKTSLQDAFQIADDILYSGVRSITDLITMPGLINLDFADIKAIMHEAGTAMMGTGEASGENRAIEAAEAAITNPLLDNSFMTGAKGVLINITGGSDMTLYEVDSSANRIVSEIKNDSVHIIFGSTFNSELEGKIRVSVVASGIKKTTTQEVEQKISRDFVGAKLGRFTNKKELENADSIVARDQAKISSNSLQELSDVNLEQQLTKDQLSEVTNETSLLDGAEVENTDNMKELSQIMQNKRRHGKEYEDMVPELHTAKPEDNFRRNPTNNTGDAFGDFLNNSITHKQELNYDENLYNKEYSEKSRYDNREKFLNQDIVQNSDLHNKKYRKEKKTSFLKKMFFWWGEKEEQIDYFNNIENSNFHRGVNNFHTREEQKLQEFPDFLHRKKDK